MKILDCTLRDGGYYTQWDFQKSLVDQYILAMNNLPVDYIEVGYRSPLQKDYHGKYFYMPIYEVENIRKKSTKKLVIILNEKDVRVPDLDGLLSPIVGLIDMIRIAIDPNNLLRAIDLAKKIKVMGFEVGFNVMYMSKWKENLDFVDSLGQIGDAVDCFYMVDSYGGVYPEDIKEIISLVNQRVDCLLGFHGHNNLELALINTLTALDCGVEFIDATILGMGRGAGNLKTELLLTVLNQKSGLHLDYNALEMAVSAIEPLLKRYEWGTNLPYMISGSNSLPQKDVMDWVTTRFYSFNSIIRALDNQRNQIEDNEKFPVIHFKQAYKVLIVGGGPSVSENIDGIITLLKNEEDMVIIHASSKNAAYFKDLKNKQFFCLVGNEGHRLEATLYSFSEINGTCILPPFPRKMGTYVPQSVKDKTYELDRVDFTDKFNDAHTAIALQITINLNPNQVLLIGYDGYSGKNISSNELKLMAENEYLFDKSKKILDSILSLSNSSYSIDCHKNLFYFLR